MLTESQRKDYAFFAAHLDEWLSDKLKQNKYVVIHNEKMEGLFDSFPAALETAYKEFREGDFIIQQIIDYKAVANFLSVGVV